MNKSLDYILYFITSLVIIWIIFVYVMSKTDSLRDDLAVDLPENLPALSPINPVEIGKKLTDTITYTLSAANKKKWAFFDFSRGSVVLDVKSLKEPKGWDIAFRRAKIISNGGETNKLGEVAISKLDTSDFDSISVAPESAEFVKDTHLPTRQETKNKNFEKWFSYQFINHKIKSLRNVYLIRTAEGNYAKMQILNYYCIKEGKRIDSCYTIKYVYQGNGSQRFGRFGSLVKKTDIK